MFKVFNYMKGIWESSTVLKKLGFLLAVLAIYRFMVAVPVPFVNIEQFMSSEGIGEGGGGLEFFAMLTGGTLEQFSILAVGLIPFINASIIMQLMSAVLPKLEELKEQGESGQVQIQQYTRYLTLPLAFVQSIGMVYFINTMLGGSIIETTFGTVLLAAFSMTVGTMILMWLGELVSETNIANGISVMIFSSIVAGMSSKIYQYISGAPEVIPVIVFMFVIILVLIVLAVLLVRTKKEIPIVYSRKGSVEDTASLPIPLNPVGMIPIIFSIAFATFPYLLSQMIVRYGSNSDTINSMANWIEGNLNIYTDQPGLLAIGIYMILIVLFTFFYTMIIFNPEKMADNIQSRGGFIPGIRPGDETANYINQNLMHLSLWGGLGLAFVGSYTYIVSYIPFVQTAIQEVGSIPSIVSGAGIIIIVGVVSDLINRLNAQLSMEKYDKI